MWNLAVLGVIYCGVAAGAARAPLHHHRVIEDEIAKTIDVDALKQGRADASNYLDQVLANVREQLTNSGFNKFPLPDQLVGFERQIGGVVWHGEARLYNGSLENMDTIHRTGVATLDTEANGDILVSAEVGVNHGKLNYNMDVTFMDLGPHTEVHGALSRVRVLLQLRITKDMHITMEKFDIKDTGLLTVDIKGLGVVLNFLVEIIAQFLGNLIKGIVVLLLEGVIKDIINDIISSILFPPTPLGVAARAAASAASTLIF